MFFGLLHQVGIRILNGWEQAQVLSNVSFVLAADTKRLLEAMSLSPLAVSNIACVREDVSSVEPFLLEAHIPGKTRLSHECKTRNYSLNEPSDFDWTKFF